MYMYVHTLILIQESVFSVLGTQRSDSHSLPPTPPLPDVSTLTHSLPVRLESSLNHTHQQPVKGAHSALSSLHKSRQLRNMAWDTKKVLYYIGALQCTCTLLYK